MAVRDFTDESGKKWRAWDIKPDAIHPATKAEDYLAECYDVGWIVFETIDEREKRRLCPYPKRWDEASEAELCGLLVRADVVPTHKLATEKKFVGEGEPALPPTTTADITDLEVVRSFRYPGGRWWTVCVMRSDPGTTPVLRFTSGMRSVDVKAWPKDWADATDESLAAILRQAMPRRAKERTAKDVDTPRRRTDD